MTGAPRHKKFNGKKYEFDSSYKHKSLAKDRASVLRNRGNLVRVVKNKTKRGFRYWVYKRWTAAGFLKRLR